MNQIKETLMDGQELVSHSTWQVRWIEGKIERKLIIESSNLTTKLHKKLVTLDGLTRSRKSMFTGKETAFQWTWTLLSTLDFKNMLPKNLYLYLKNAFLQAHDAWKHISSTKFLSRSAEPPTCIIPTTSVKHKAGGVTNAGWDAGNGAIEKVNIQQTKKIKVISIRWGIGVACSDNRESHGQPKKQLKSNDTGAEKSKVKCKHNKRWPQAG